MIDVEATNRALQQLQQQLNAPQLAPDRTRRDWAEAQELSC